MRIEILIGGKLHGTRNWAAVPSTGQDVWVENILQVRGFDRAQDGALKVVAVLWHRDKVQVNLITPDSDRK